MKKPLSILLSLVMILTALPLTAVNSFANTSGDWYYRVLDDGTAEIYNSSDKAAYRGNKTDVTIPLQIDGYTVTSIGEYAFYNCTSLTSITIPDSVTSIGWYAFYNCTSLTSITIPDSVTSIGHSAFENCTSLESITILDSVTSIGSSAFGYYKSLTSIKIPNSVTSIGDLAFEHCTSLKGINVDKANNNYCSEDGVLFNKDKTELICYPAGKTNSTYTVPNSVTSIRDCAFEYCISLTSITIPNSVISIGSWAFFNCTSIENITIPDSVTSIGGQAFYNTAYYNNEANWENGVLYIGNHLIDVKSDTVSADCKIKEGTITIADYAFHECTSLKSITIPSSVTSIGVYNFEKYTSLESVNVNETNRNYSSEDGVLFNKDKAELICYPAGKKNSTYIVPNSVTSIEEYAFCNCTSLTSVTIPDSVTNIGVYAFLNCNLLTNISVDFDNRNYSSENGILFNKNKTILICYPCGKASNTYTIPDKVTNIEEYAFYNCTSLTSVVIGNSVKSIGDGAFSSCTSLESIIIPNSVKIIESWAFI